MSELQRWRDAVDEVTTHLLSYTERAENVWLRDFPHGSCSVTSYAIGRLLLERYNEQWLLISRSSDHLSHTWLTRDDSAGASAAIDATLHQFPDLGTEPFVGWGTSPAANQFRDSIGSPIYVALVEDGWHHGQTEEVYEWLFPRLGLRPFRRMESLRELMPPNLAFPPVSRLVDTMIHAARLTDEHCPYAIVLNPTASSVLRRNSDAAMRRHDQERDQYLGLHIIEQTEVPDNVVLLIPVAEKVHVDEVCVVGSISSGRFEALSRSEFDRFDFSSLA